ncbi:hypothetical protein MBM_09619 [Drepanopeziza brunnea f. sp. 'multigermtubi' MB_m1]|uniref:Uncharacterized protein n=1 Tax=Marssonina brunnea f. sp. multigermtubi (strain MB_m1) TaxID=1072389 RepID=K1WUK6_MARBU|nr:uncharacterized protein MBM_09619 [Drepanopeziza brunnea f. sp. 'multigermtubi' MB_m1]EKD12298.1 hypothetical protein MBM_09619 [Drepanopeziza brunnea f. sp. 'multigermtubi' MB_m1]
MAPAHTCLYIKYLQQIEEVSSTVPSVDNVEKGGHLPVPVASDYDVYYTLPGPLGLAWEQDVLLPVVQQAAAEKVKSEFLSPRERVLMKSFVIISQRSGKRVCVLGAFEDHAG